MRNLIKITITTGILIYGNLMMLSQTSVKNNDELIKVPIKNLSIKDKNIHLTLSEISRNFQTPIGLIVSQNDDLLTGITISINKKESTLKEVLDSIIEQNPLYTWEEKNGVVNVFPKDGEKDSFLEELLQTKIEKISIPKGTSRSIIRDSITRLPEVSMVLEKNNIKAENGIFSLYDVSPIGKSFSLDDTDTTVRELLNEIIKRSDTKYWIVNRIGKNKEYLLINF